MIRPMSHLNGAVRGWRRARGLACTHTGGYGTISFTGAASMTMTKPVARFPAA
jgi:hypothetical protein